MNLSGLGPFGFEQIITVALLPIAGLIELLAGQAISIVGSWGLAFRHPSVSLANFAVRGLNPFKYVLKFYQIIYIIFYITPPDIRLKF